MWPFDRADDDDNPLRWELKKIQWTEEVEREYTIRTERLVWSGGAEKEVEYVVEKSDYADAMDRAFYGMDGELIFVALQQPAYTEVIDEAAKTVTEDAYRYAWITGDPPEWAEDTGTRMKVKEVVV